MVGSAAALSPGDVITTQYREHGVFLQRGFELKDFMIQLTANKNDPGKGRNMPVHYSGKAKVNIVSHLVFPVHLRVIQADCLAAASTPSPPPSALKSPTQPEQPTP